MNSKCNSKKYHFKPRCSKKFAFESMSEENLHIMIRCYADGVRKHSATDERIRKNIGSKAFVEPIILWLDEVNYNLSGAKEQIQRAIDKDDFTDIHERMIIEGESVLEVISNKPLPPDLVGKAAEDELVIEQIIEYFEDLCGRIESELMDTYYYLVGAKF
ncbi:hypothetical protein V2S84_10095 [Azotobacter chroococcum]|nr:hypothetical protein [Azotobacter chroococcum]